MRKLKLLLLAIILAAPTLNVFAQDEDPDIIKGARIGWQMSNIYNKGEALGDNLSSFYVGVFGEKKLVPLLRLGLGLEYNSVGFNVAGINDTKYVRHSLAVPAYLKVKLGPVFVLGGVEPNIAIAEKVTLLGQEIDLEKDISTSSFDLPIIVGLGLQISIVTIEARYHYGTMNIYENPTTTFTQNYFQVGGAISF